MTAMKSKMNLEDERIAGALPNLIVYHEKMLADGVRNELLARSIERRITPETRFLDVGAGTGVWAILAAKLGARRAVAIEVEKELIPMIHKHAQENGVAHLIEIIHGRSDDVRIRGKFDVIVCELFGASAYSPATVASFVDLRTRFLAPNGILIPQKLSLFAAPVHFEKFARPLPAGLNISSNYLRSLRTNFPFNVPLAERDLIRILAEPNQISEMDFRTILEPPSLEGLGSIWEVEDRSAVNAFVTFDRSTFDDGIEMSNLESQSWGAIIYPIDPTSSTGRGKIAFGLRMTEKGSFWSVGFPDDPNAKPASYSPLLAGSRVKMATMMTPYKKTRKKGR